MFRWTLRGLLVTLDWLALFGVTVVLLLVLVAPLLSGLFGPSQPLGVIATAGSFFIAAVVATLVNGPLRRTLFSLGRPGAADPHLPAADRADRRRRIQVRLAFLALALALVGVPLAAYLAGSDNRSSAGRSSPTPIASTAGQPSLSPSPSPAQASAGTGAGPVAATPSGPTETPSVSAPSPVSSATAAPAAGTTSSPTVPPTVSATTMPTETLPPAPTAAPAAPAPTDLPTPRPIPLMADDFDNPATGLLSKSSTLPSYYSLGYVDGEYAIKKLIPGWAQSPGVPLPGRHAATSIAVDARIVGETAQRFLVVACRDQGAQGIDSNYRLQVAPGDGTFSLARWDRGREAHLVAWTPSPAIRTGNQVNRLELVCVGARIAALINGTQVASVADGTYTDGQLLLLVSHRGTVQATVEGRFDNLVVTRP